MSADTKIIAEKYAYAIQQAKARAVAHRATVYVLAALAVNEGVPYVSGFVLSDKHDGATVCRVSVCTSGSVLITEV